MGFMDAYPAYVILTPTIIQETLLDNKLDRLDGPATGLSDSAGASTMVAPPILRARHSNLVPCWQDSLHLGRPRLPKSPSEIPRNWIISKPVPHEGLNAPFKPGFYQKTGWNRSIDRALPKGESHFSLSQICIWLSVGTNRPLMGIFADSISISAGGQRGTFPLHLPTFHSSASRAMCLHGRCITIEDKGR